MTHSGAAGANQPHLTFCSAADMSLKMERHRQRTQPFWKKPSTCFGNRDLSLFRLHVFGLLVWTKGKLQRL